MPRRKPRPQPPDWDEAVRQFTDGLIAAERSPLTIAAYSDDLKHFHRWYRATYEDPPGLMTIDDVELRRWKQHQVETLHHKPRSINRRLVTLRKFLTWSQSRGWTLELAIPRSIGLVRLGPQWLTIKEERALRRELKARADNRDNAVVITFLETDIRASELAGILGRHIRMSERKGELDVLGKGSKWRTIPLNPTARAALARLGPCGPDEHRFVGQRGRLTKSGAQKLVSSYGPPIGLDLHCHLLRHNADSRIMPTETLVLWFFRLFPRSLESPLAKTTRHNPDVLPPCARAISQK
jgi:site-specific recombinase XerD